MDAQSRETLRQRWHALLSPFGNDLAAREAAFVDLERRYSEPSRYYHTMEHIRAVEWAVHQLLAPLSLPATNWDSNWRLTLWPALPGTNRLAQPAPYLAAILHDVIYDTHAHNNEELSAEYADGVLKNLGVPDEVREEVSRLILLTKIHEAPREDLRACALIDADLAILSTDQRTYDAYATAIRREYEWVPEADYRAGRAKVLRQFLARPCIYHNEEWQERREPMARANLTRELASLEGSR